MRGTVRTWAAGLARASMLALAAATLSGCPQHPGRLVVVVHTDFDVPTELGEIEVEVARVDGTRSEVVPFTLRSDTAPIPEPDDGTQTMPLSFTVAPTEPDLDVKIRLVGRQAG